VRREEQIGAKCGIKRGFQLEQSEKIPDPFVLPKDDEGGRLVLHRQCGYSCLII
jgi:hypothetical protein